MLSFAYNNSDEECFGGEVNSPVFYQMAGKRLFYILAWTISQLDFELLEDREHFFYFSLISKYCNKEENIPIISPLKPIRSVTLIFPAKYCHGLRILKN